MAKTKILSTMRNIFFGVMLTSIIFANAAQAQAIYSAASLVSLTNSERASAGLGALSVNSALTSAAQAKANDMIAKNYFAHTSPDGKTPWDFIHGAGYNYTFAGENLAIAYTNASGLMNDWMNSPAHRANILNSNFREIGIAVVSGKYNGVDTIVVAQEFGASQSVAEVSSEPTPQAQTAGENTTPESTPSAAKSPASFELNKQKSQFEPKSIFAGEQFNFTVVISGEIKSLNAQVGDLKTNLLESGTSSISGNEKIYSYSQKIDNPGLYEISINAEDSSGNLKTLLLGQLEVKPTVLAKSETQSNNSGLVAGFKSTLTNYWYIFLLGGIVLTVVGLVIFKKIKIGKLEKLGLASWNI